jgi:plasmid stabilization system protein ParE
MAGRVIWSQEGLDDIDAIAAYIARDSITHARRFVSEAFDLADLLLTQPRMGRIVPELRQDRVREHFIYSYRILYEIEGEDLHVLAVIHGKRLLESVAERFDQP